MTTDGKPYKHESKIGVANVNKYTVDVGHINDPTSQNRAKALAVAQYLGWRKSLDLCRQIRLAFKEGRSEEETIRLAARMMAMVAGCDYSWSFVFLNRIFKTNIQPGVNNHGNG